MSTDNEMVEDVVKDLAVESKQPTEEFIDESFVDDGDSLIGEKYTAPAKDQKFVDVHKGTIVDKKDVAPLMQIKAFLESNGIKHGEPKKSCKKCYGRGYIGFDTKCLSWIPCGCLFPAQTKVQREMAQEAWARDVNTPKNRRYIRRMKKREFNKLIHQKSLELLKNPKPSPKIEEENANG